jgi:tRNA(Ile)-lysidine synthase
MEIQLSIEDVFNSTIREYNMLEPGDRVVAGVSGGPDSIAMLHLLHRFKDLYKIQIIAAHLNHNFRPGFAERDAEFVKDFCSRIGIPCVIEFCDVPQLAVQLGLSSEQAGRRARYGFFNRVMEQKGYNKIAVAHNRDDQVETFLMRLIRGAGAEGLAGIRPVRGSIIRPLLEVPRSAIEGYCSRHRLNPVVDHTNLEPIYTRNRIRLELLPYLREKYNPSIDRSILDASRILMQENDCLSRTAEQVYKELVIKTRQNAVELDAGAMSRLHAALAGRIVRLAIKEIKGNTNNISYGHIDSVCRLVKTGDTGKELHLPGGLTARLSYRTLIMDGSKQSPARIVKEYHLEVPGLVIIDETGAEIEAGVIDKSMYRPPKAEDRGNVCYLDIDKTGNYLTVTGRKSGDRFRPLGMNGTRKLKDFFIDLKVPRDKRDAVPIVRSPDGIVWVVGYRIDDSYKITPTTGKVLRLIYRTGYSEEDWYERLH